MFLSTTLPGRWSVFCVGVGVLAAVAADESLSLELYLSMRAAILMRLGSACRGPERSGPHHPGSRPCGRRQ